MQKTFKIKTLDKRHAIYGTLDKIGNPKKVIIFVHGLTGDQHEQKFFNAPDFFNKLGFATIRFDLYSHRPGSRLLINSTVETHSKDLNAVINYAKGNYKEIYLVGHSLGGPTIMYADLSGIERIVLWDPSVNLDTEATNWYKFNKKIDAYIVNWGTNFILGRKMVEGWKKISDYNDVVDKIKTPIKVICARKEGVRIGSWKKALKKIKAPNNLTEIKEASHDFTEYKVLEKLYKETINWYRK